MPAIFVLRRISPFAIRAFAVRLDCGGGFQALMIQTLPPSRRFALLGAMTLILGSAPIHASDLFTPRTCHILRRQSEGH